MAIRNILVAYNGLPGSDAALQGAVEMQKTLDTHLTGLFAHGNPLLSRHLHRTWMPKKLQEAIVEAADSPTAELRDKFDAICADIAPEKRNWIDSGGSVQRTVARYARLFDITVLGLHEKSRDHSLSHIELYPDRIALESGRPVMIFPTEPAPGFLQKPIVVAWDGKRAAARALGDAMLLLQKGHKIDIVSVGGPPINDATPGVDIHSLLAHHGLNVTISEIAREGKSISDRLVEHCAEVGAGILVMGAYEHSPLQEGLFGGVTQDISLRAEIPVLMSH